MSVLWQERRVVVRGGKSVAMGECIGGQTIELTQTNDGYFPLLIYANSGAIIASRLDFPIYTWVSE